jgi:hypothetical protein
MNKQKVTLEFEEGDEIYEYLKTITEAYRIADSPNWTVDEMAEWLLGQKATEYMVDSDYEFSRLIKMVSEE